MAKKTMRQTIKELEKKGPYQTSQVKVAGGMRYTRKKLKKRKR